MSTTIDIKVPVLPESVADATIAAWHKRPGDVVYRDEILVDIETDKVVLEVSAPEDGALAEIIKTEGSTVKAHEVIATFSTVMPQNVTNENNVKNTTENNATSVVKKTDDEIETEEVTLEPMKTEEFNESANFTNKENKFSGAISENGVDDKINLSPSQRRAMHERESEEQKSVIDANKNEKQVDIAKKEEVSKKEDNLKKEAEIKQEDTSTTKVSSIKPDSRLRSEERVPMTRLRARIAERLLSAQHNAAILTTFNEINMQPVITLRNKYKEEFEHKYGVKLGYMSFFVSAVVEALKKFPVINASVDGNDIVYHGYFDVGIAVSTERGLVVPILRNADSLSMAEIEQKIKEYSEQARSGKISLDDITGGTFTITNGGVFGSLMATPIINPPQSAILGMHKIEERPVVENKQVVIRPMMYVALSYDHRIIDGAESVQFLVTVKELLEDPARLVLRI